MHCCFKSPKKVKTSSHLTFTSKHTFLYKPTNIISYYQKNKNKNKKLISSQFKYVINIYKYS